MWGLNIKVGMPSIPHIVTFAHVLHWPIDKGKGSFFLLLHPNHNRRFGRKTYFVRFLLKWASIGRNRAPQGLENSIFSKIENDIIP